MSTFTRSSSRSTYERLDQEDPPGLDQNVHDDVDIDLTTHCDSFDPLRTRSAAFIRKTQSGFMTKLLIIQGILCGLDVILATLVFFPLALVYSEFGDNCVLYAKLAVKQGETHNHTLQIILSKTEYGNPKTCDFTTYINVVLAIASVIFIWFFLHSKDNKSQVKLLVPNLIVKLMFLICVAISSDLITEGSASFCSHLEENEINKKRLSCSQYEEFQWTLDTISTFYTYLNLAEICSWVLMCLLLTECMYTFFHLYADYRSNQTGTGDKQVSETDGLVMSEHGAVNRGADGSSLAQSYSDTGDLPVITDDAGSVNLDVHASSEIFGDQGGGGDRNNVVDQQNSLYRSDLSLSQQIPDPSNDGDEVTHTKDLVTVDVHLNTNLEDNIKT